jgi:hypothetical protein
VSQRHDTLKGGTRLDTNKTAGSRIYFFAQRDRPEGEKRQGRRGERRTADLGGGWEMLFEAVADERRKDRFNLQPIL